MAGIQEKKKTGLDTVSGVNLCFILNKEPLCPLIYEMGAPSACRVENYLFITLFYSPAHPAAVTSSDGGGELTVAGRR